MTESTIIAIVGSIVGAIPPTLMALAAYRQGQTNGKKSDTLIEKAVEIHTLTNGSLSKVQASLETANEKIMGLEKLVGSMNLSALAASVASKDAIKAALDTPSKS